MSVHVMSSKISQVFSFPHPANDVAARMVAGMVVALGLAIILFQVPWLLFIMAYEFLARVFTGPSLSVMGSLATKGLLPLLGNPVRPVAGPPKQFAQAVGLGFSIASLLLYYVFHLPVAAYGVLGVLVFFAALEAVLGFCTGCFVFGYLMRWGLIPRDTCERCNNLSFRSPGAGQS
jgi:hypothetical protein